MRTIAELIFIVVVGLGLGAAVSSLRADILYNCPGSSEWVTNPADCKNQN